jgi:hypothetical protein
MPSLLQEILDSPKLSRIRRNHGLEHATIHLLTARYPRALLVGRSDAQGFYLYGDVPTEAVEQAVVEALDRLRAGEHRLALHPNCGTSFVTAGTLSGLAAFLTTLGPKDERRCDRWARLPFTILAATLGVIVAQPLGLAVQRHLTTKAAPGSLSLLGVQRPRPGGAVIHRVLTNG